MKMDFSQSLIISEKTFNNLNDEERMAINEGGPCVNDKADVIQESPTRSTNGAHQLSKSNNVSNKKNRRHLRKSICDSKTAKKVLKTDLQNSLVDNNKPEKQIVDKVEELIVSKVVKVMDISDESDNEANYEMLNKNLHYSETQEQLDVSSFLGPMEMSKDKLNCMSEETKDAANKQFVQSPQKAQTETLNSSTKRTVALDFESLKDIGNWYLPKSIVTEYKRKGVIKMFDWQVECLSNSKVLFEHCNLVYSAPTSAGKTLVSEILLLKTVSEREKKVLLILPFISVVREKMYYLQDLLTPSGYRVEGFFGGYAPAGGFDSINVAVTTIEKANSIVNKLLEQGKLDTIGTIIVDEIHLISDPARGYILELLLAKILYMTSKYGMTIQIIAMSATLANVKLLKRWLAAEQFVTSFRPVALKEMIKINNEIFDVKLNRIRDVTISGADQEPFPVLQNDTDHVAQLCLETVAHNCSVIVFCPYKDWCENLALQLAKHIRAVCKNGGIWGSQLQQQLNRTDLDEVKKQLEDIPAGLDELLGKTIMFGCAFHHAGLTTEERDVVETSFKSGALKIIVATSTLSSGVNLPARRVIIRSPLFAGKSMNSITYKQMIGRAGRTGKDTLGESILICNKSNVDVGKRLITADLQPISSCLEINDSTHLKRALLEAIASGVVMTKQDIDRFVKCTLLSIQKLLVIEGNGCLSEDYAYTSDSLKYLIDNEFVRLQINEETTEETYVPTRLGMACLASSMPPADGLLLFAELKTARQCFVLESELHAVYLVTPYSVCYQLQDLDWLLYLDIWEHLTPAMKKVGELVGVKESFLVRAMRQQAKLDYKQMQIHKRFYTALALQELIEEIPIKEVALKYKCTRGMLQGLQQISSTFAGIVTAFCNSLEFSTLSLILSQFKERLYFGIHRDLIDLMRLPDLNYKRARALYDAGLTSIVKLANADVFSVEKIMHNLLSFDSAKQHENENVYEAEQRNVLRNFYITGKSGITVADAAKLLVQEARRFVQYEIGVGTINWAQNTKNDLETDRIHMSYEEENLKVCNRKRKSSENLSTSQLKIAKSIESKEKHLIDLCTELNDKPSTSAKAKETLHKINILEKEIKETSGEKLMITSSENNNKQTNNGDMVGKQFSELKLTNLIKESTINNKEELSKYEKTIDNKKYNLRTSEEKKPIIVVNDGQIIKSIEIEPQTVTTKSLSSFSPKLKKTQTTVNEPSNKTVKDTNEIQKSLEHLQNSVTIPRRSRRNHSKETTKNLTDVSMTDESFELNTGIAELLDIDRANEIGKDSNEIRKSLVLSQNSITKPGRSRRNHSKETTKNMNDVSMTDESFELKTDIAEVLDIDRANKYGISTNEIQKCLVLSQNSVTIPHRSRRNHSKETTKNMNLSMTDESFKLNTGIAEVLDIDKTNKCGEGTNDIQKSLVLSQNSVIIPRRSRRIHSKETTKNLTDVSMTDDSFELNTGIAELLDINRANEIGKDTNEIRKSIVLSQNLVTIPRRSRGNHSKETTKNMNDMLMTDESFELNTGIAEVLNIDKAKKDVQYKNEIQMGLTYSSNSATNPCRNRRNHSKETTKNINDMLMTDESFELNTSIIEVLDIDKTNKDVKNNIKIQNSLANTHYLETRSHQHQRNHSKVRTSNGTASTNAIMEQKIHMDDLLITDDSFQLNTGIAQMLDIKLTETNATPIIGEKGTLNINNDDEIPNSQLAEKPELEKTPFRSRLIRTRRATFKESEINSGLETNNDVHNTKNSTGISIEISDPSIKGCLITDPSHINVTSISNNATTSSGFECVKIVDVCGNLQLFQSTFEELMTSKCFGFCLGLESILEKRKPVIGANAANNQDLTKEEVEATKDTANFQIDNVCFLAGIAFCVSQNIVYYINMQEKESNAAVTNELKCEYLHMILKAKENTLLIFDAKEQLKTLRKLLPDLGEICAKFEDPKVANWLLQPDKTITFKQMAQQFAPECTGLIGLCGSSGRGTRSYGLDNNNGISAKVRSSIEACCTIHILKEQIENLKKIGDGSLHKFFLETEMPLQLSLCNMETIGFPTSESELHKLIKKLLYLQRTLETKIYEAHGRRFNLTSSTEVAKVLGLHLKSGKRITTSKQILEKIESPISKLIINYRKVNSILTNNILPLSECVQNNRIYGESNTFTSTGRISMAEPNLQNVAKHFEVYTGNSDNLEISCRSAFYPTDPKRWLISVDFCQLEMRILAHLSQDPALLKVMRTEKDIFTAIAARWYKVSDDNVTEQLRNDTKKICYGIVYGMGMCSLADSLKCTEEQANLLSKEFHAAYPRIRTYADKIVRFARINGYIETITGRRRYVENINSAEIKTKNQAERRAINASIQGSAADIVKSAILFTEKNIQKYSSDLGIEENSVRLVLHVHDELIFEVPKDKAKKIAKFLSKSMEKCVKLKVSLKVKVKIGKSWGELK